MAAAGCNGQLNQPMNLVVATRDSTMVNPGGLGDVSVGVLDRQTYQGGTRGS
jgi:hypothetical protein